MDYYGPEGGAVIPLPATKVGSPPWEKMGIDAVIVMLESPTVITTPAAN